MPVDPAALKKLQSSKRLGGKGTPRRKQAGQKKQNNASSESKKVQQALKKVANTSLDQIDEVNMFIEDGSVIHFKNPAVFCAPASNTFTVSGKNDTKKISEIPQVLNQLGLEGLQAWAQSSKANEILESMKTGVNNAKKEMGLPTKIESFEQPEEDEVE